MKRVLKNEGIFKFQVKHKGYNLLQFLTINKVLIEMFFYQDDTH